MDNVGLTTPRVTEKKLEFQEGLVWSKVVALTYWRADLGFVNWLLPAKVDLQPRLPVTFSVLAVTHLSLTAHPSVQCNVPCPPTGSLETRMEVAVRSGTVRTRQLDGCTVPSRQ